MMITWHEQGKDTRAEGGAAPNALCLQAALRYLSYRPRSEAELRQRLTGRGFPEEAIENTLCQLKGEGLLNDLAFARFWRDSRETFKPRSAFALRLELRGKGVEEGIIEEALKGLDEESCALRAARRRARLLAGLDRVTFQRRLGAFLRRRGFSYGIIRRITKGLWLQTLGHDST